MMLWRLSHSPTWDWVVLLFRCLTCSEPRFFGGGGRITSGSCPPPRCTRPCLARSNSLPANLSNLSIISEVRTLPLYPEETTICFSLFLRVLNHAFLVEGGGFEPPKVEPADLQSAPFGRSGTPPEKIKPRILLVQYAAVNRNWMIRRTKIMELVDGIEPPTC